MEEEDEEEDWHCLQVLIPMHLGHVEVSLQLPQILNPLSAQNKHHSVNTFHTEKHKTANNTVLIFSTQDCWYPNLNTYKCKTAGILQCQYSWHRQAQDGKYQYQCSLHKTAGTTASIVSTQASTRLPIPLCQYSLHRQVQDCQYHHVNTLYTGKHKTANTTMSILSTQASTRLPIPPCQYSLHRQAQDIKYHSLNTFYTDKHKTISITE